MNDIKDKHHNREDYYKSLKVGDIVFYNSRVPWDYIHIDMGVLEHIGEWDDNREPKMSVSIMKLKCIIYTQI